MRIDRTWHEDGWLIRIYDGEVLLLLIILLLIIAFVIGYLMKKYEVIGKLNGVKHYCREKLTSKVK